MITCTGIGINRLRKTPKTHKSTATVQIGARIGRSGVYESGIVCKGFSELSGTKM